MAIIKWSNFIYDPHFWIVLFSKIIFRVLILKVKHTQMAEQLDATKIICFTKVSISANLILGTIRRLCLAGRDSSSSCKKRGEENEQK